MRILLVEDEIALADVIARNLRVRGHEVLLAATAESALDAAISELPDVVILDINLPDLTGWEVLRRQTEVQRSRARVIVISAAPVSPKRIEEFKPYRTLQKPFPIDALVRILNEIGAAAASTAQDAS